MMKKINRASMVWQSGINKRYIQDYVDLVEKFTKDPKKKERLQKQECIYCFYSSRIGGAAMTNKQCISCNESSLYSSTATDDLCKSCAEKYELCKHCGADIKLRINRKDWKGL